MLGRWLQDRIVRPLWVYFGHEHDFRPFEKVIFNDFTGEPHMLTVDRCVTCGTERPRGTGPIAMTLLLILLAVPVSAAQIDFSFPMSYGDLAVNGDTLTFDQLFWQNWRSRVDAPNGTFALLGGELQATGTLAGPTSVSGSFDLAVGEGTHHGTLNGVISDATVNGVGFVFALSDVLFDAQTSALLGLPDSPFSGWQALYLDRIDATHAKTFGYLSLGSLDAQIEPVFLSSRAFRSFDVAAFDVPEPGTLILMAGGLSLVFRKRGWCRWGWRS